MSFLLAVFILHVFFQLDDGDYLLENGILKARVRAGLLISLYHKESQR